MPTAQARSEALGDDHRAASLELVRADGEHPDGSTDQGAGWVRVWQVQVGDVVSSPDLHRAGPRRIVAIGRLPGMRKLFLADPGDPAPRARYSASALRTMPHRTLGEDVVVTVLEPAAPDQVNRPSR